MRYELEALDRRGFQALVPVHVAIKLQSMKVLIPIVRQREAKINLPRCARTLGRGAEATVSLR